MQEYRGVLKRVGSKEGDMIVNSNGAGAVGNVRVSGKVSLIEIGDTMLRNVACTRDIYDLLEPGKEAILYVHHHFFRTPMIVAVGYPGEGRTYRMTMGNIFANAMSYIIMYPLFFLVGGFVSTMFLGHTLGWLIILGGIGFSFGNAALLVAGYAKIPAH